MPDLTASKSLPLFLPWTTAQRAQVEATQLQQRLLEQELANLEQMMEDNKRHNEEGIQRLKEEWEEEMKKMKEEAERRKRDFRKVMRGMHGTVFTFTLLLLF